MRPQHRHALVIAFVSLASAWLASHALALQVGPMPAVADNESRTTEIPSSESTTPLGPPASTTEHARIGERSAGGLGILRTLGALGVVTGLAIAGWVIVRLLARAHGGLAATFGPAGRAPSGVLEVLGRYPVGRAQTLVLLRVDRRVLLLSQSATGRLGAGAAFTTLCEITEPEDVASILVKSRDDESAQNASRFNSLLSRFEQEHQAPFDAQGRDIPVVDLTRTNRVAGFIDRVRQRFDPAPSRGGAV
jgi:flagellar biogenesis protein FliO